MTVQSFVTVKNVAAAAAAAAAVVAKKKKKEEEEEAEQAIDGSKCRSQEP